MDNGLSETLRGNITLTDGPSPAVQVGESGRLQQACCERGHDVAELPPRFQRKISIDAKGCWRWRGFVDRAGYGQVKHKGKNSTPHRAVYEILHGPIADEDVDHLCRVRDCCNPSHVEPVTHRENMRRSIAPAGLNARKTHCKRGHEFNTENTIATKGGGRNCRACLRLRHPRTATWNRLTKPQVAEIRGLLATDATRVSIAVRFGVSKTLITRIAQGKCHAEVAS